MRHKALGVWWSLYYVRKYGLASSLLFFHQCIRYTEVLLHGLDMKNVHVVVASEFCHAMDRTRDPEHH